MARQRIDAHPAYVRMAKILDPMQSEIKALKESHKRELDAIARRHEIEKSAAIQQAFADGLSKYAICKYFGITAGHAQDALMAKVMGDDWTEIAIGDPNELDRKPYEMGDWRVKRNFIRHDSVFTIGGWDCPNFCEGSLWNDALDVRLTFVIRWGDRGTTDYFYEDGSEVDTIHFDKVAGDQGGTTARDDGTFYEYGAPGKWYSEAEDIDKWLTQGYRWKRDGWPQP